jgi:hypothetical protein
MTALKTINKTLYHCIMNVQSRKNKQKTIIKILTLTGNLEAAITTKNRKDYIIWSYKKKGFQFGSRFLLHVTFKEKEIL